MTDAPDTALDWHTAAKAYLQRLCAAEHAAQRAAWKRSPKAYRYSPSAYANALIDCLNRNDEEGFKARKMLEGYASAAGV
jgi:hypothetical protein